MRLKTAFVCVLCAATLAHTPSAIAAADDLFCANYQDDSFMRKIRKSLASVSESIPNIPPEHAAYLEAEEAAALKALNKEVEQNDWRVLPNSPAGTRLYALQHRPYYNAWKVRRSLTEAQDAILAIPKDLQYGIFKDNPEAEKARRATAALGKTTDLAITITEMLDNERLQPALTSSDDLGNLSAQRIHIPGELRFYIDCKLRKIAR